MMWTTRAARPRMAPAVRSRVSTSPSCRAITHLLTSSRMWFSLGGKKILTVNGSGQTQGFRKDKIILVWTIFVYPWEKKRNAWAKLKMLSVEFSEVSPAYLGPGQRSSSLSRDAKNGNILNIKSMFVVIDWLDSCVSTLRTRFTKISDSTHKIDCVHY